MTPIIPEGELIPANIPVIVHEGRYRLYRKPNGDLHLVYKRDDSETEDHMELPGRMLALAQGMSEGKLSFLEFAKESMSLISELKKQ